MTLSIYSAGDACHDLCCVSIQHERILVRGGGDVPRHCHDTNK